jgi:rhodanese-related sulfurtransferase
MDNLLEEQQEFEVLELVKQVLHQKQTRLDEDVLLQVAEEFQAEWFDVIPETEYEARILEIAEMHVDQIDETNRD